MASPDSRTRVSVALARFRQPFARARLDTVAWLLLAGFVGYRIAPQIAAAAGVASANVAVPPFSVTTLDGQHLSDASLKGRVVLLNFWATWCPPCRVEMPGFQRVYERYRADGLVVVGVAMDQGGTAGIARFLADHHITYPVGLATPEIVQQFGGVRLLPTTFLIGRDGRVRNEVSGLFASAALDQAVQRLLADGTSGTASTDSVRRIQR